MSDNPNVSQSDLQQAFESYHQMILPYLGGGGSGGTGFTPVGTVIAYYGETAPAHYLICDGSEYNKTDYPDLWTHLSSLTDTTPYVVDGNNTKFKVPDLRGEFLRGSGTNGHTNQFTGILEGSGSNVGQHQDATVFTDTQYIKSNETVHYTNKTAYNTVFPRNPDTVVPSTYFTGNPNAVYNVFSASRIDTNVETLPTSRPTNTSVLFCIAYHDIQIYSVEQPHQYSTEEKVVGTWIDGRPIYENFFYGTIGNSSTESTNLVVSNVSTLVNANGYATQSGVDFVIPQATTNECLRFIRDSNNVNLLVRGSFFTNASYTAILQYTKTTDTPSV